MRYDQLVDKLRKHQSIRIRWHNHEISILADKGFIWIGSIFSVLLLVFRNLSEALEQCHFPEEQTTLGKIIPEINGADVDSNPDFREITILDPKLLVEPTNLLRNSMPGGEMVPDSSVERNVQCMIESITSCLYNLTLETKVYQTLEWQWLKKMLDEKRILFKNPSDYHDAWESFMFHKYDWEEGTDECRRQLIGAGKNFYCSCWSTCEESDGIWNNRVRGRSSGDNSLLQEELQGSHKRDELIDSQLLKIETTVGDLLCSLKLNELFGGPNIWKNFRAGLVNYFDEFELRKFKERTLRMMEARKDIWLKFYLPHLIRQSFFMKRKQFEYEQEVRLVLFDNAESIQKDQLGIYLQTEPYRWIHEVVVNPDCRANDYEYILKQLSTHGIDRVIKSPLTRHFNQELSMEYLFTK